jgi:hypothetical protein
VDRVRGNVWCKAGVRQVSVCFGMRGGVKGGRGETGEAWQKSHRSHSTRWPAREGRQVASRAADGHLPVNIDPARYEMLMVWGREPTKNLANAFTACGAGRGRRVSECV